MAVSTPNMSGQSWEHFKGIEDMIAQACGELAVEVTSNTEIGVIAQACGELAVEVTSNTEIGVNERVDKDGTVSCVRRHTPAQVVPSANGITSYPLPKNDE